MELSINKYNQPIEGNTGIHPKKFMMMLAMVSMTMMFIALTSALLVKKGDTVKWMNFSLPPIFLVSTLVIILSSVTIQWSYKLYVKGQALYKLILLLTFLLSVIFSILQYKGWQQIKAIGFPFNGNVSGSFVYVITGFHLAHLVGGVIAIFLTLISHSFHIKFQKKHKLLLMATLLLSIVYNIFQYKRLDTNHGLHIAYIIFAIVAFIITFFTLISKLNPIDEIKQVAEINRKVNMEILLMFWHFLGGLWIYLCAFLYIVYNI